MGKQAHKPLSGSGNLSRERGRGKEQTGIRAIVGGLIGVHHSLSTSKRIAIT